MASQEQKGWSWECVSLVAVEGTWEKQCGVKQKRQKFGLN